MSSLPRAFLSRPLHSRSGSNTPAAAPCPTVPVQHPARFKTATFKQTALALGIALTSGMLTSGAVNAGTLAEIYQEALRSDPQLRVALFTSRADAEIKEQRQALLLPDIDLQAETGYRDSSPSSNTEGNNHGYTLSLTQPVFRADRWFDYQGGKILGEKAELNFAQAQQDLINRVITAYLDVLQAQRVYETTQAEETAFKRRLDQVQAQFDVGLIAITDVEEAKSGFDSARVSRIDAQVELDNSYEALIRLTGESWENIDRLQEGYPVTTPEPAQAQPWVQKALDGNLALQLAAKDINVALQDRKASEAGHYPTLDVVASYNDSDNGAMGNQQDTYIGLTLNLPIYAGGGTSSEVRESYHRWDASLETFDDTKRAVIQDTRSLFRDIITDADSVAARRQAMNSARTALESIEAGYSVGTRDIVDVLDAERDLYATIRDYQIARFTSIRNRIDFKQALGTLNPEDLYQLDRWMEPPSPADDPPAPEDMPR